MKEIVYNISFNHGGDSAELKGRINESRQVDCQRMPWKKLKLVYLSSSIAELTRFSIVVHRMAFFTAFCLYHSEISCWVSNFAG